jgi:hypothetical protein
LVRNISISKTLYEGVHNRDVDYDIWLAYSDEPGQSMRGKCSAITTVYTDSTMVAWPHISALHDSLVPKTSSRIPANSSSLRYYLPIGSSPTAWSRNMSPDMIVWRTFPHIRQYVHMHEMHQRTHRISTKPYIENFRVQAKGKSGVRCSARSIGAKTEHSQW